MYHIAEQVSESESKESIKPFIVFSKFMSGTFNFHNNCSPFENPFLLVLFSSCVHTCTVCIMETCYLNKYECGIPGSHEIFVHSLSWFEPRSDEQGWGKESEELLNIVCR